MSLFSFLSNPVTLAAAAVIAFGVIVYEIVNHQKEERVHRGGRRGPSNPPSHCRSESCNITSYDNLDSNIRRRKREETEIKNRPKVAKNEEKFSNGSKGSSPKSEFDEKNYYQNVFQKIESDVKNFNQADDKEKFFHKNIDDSVADSSASSVPVNINEPKLMNITNSDSNKKGIHFKNQAAPSKRSKVENIVNTREMSPINNDGHTYCSGGTVVNDQATSSKRSKRENIVNTQEIFSTNNDDPTCSSGGTVVNDQATASRRVNAVSTPEISPTNNDDPTYSGTTTVNDRQSHAGTEDVKCMACEETLANAFAVPCKHCYMCMDCAMMVHRIYKKCTICDSDVDHFEDFTVSVNLI